MADKGPDYDIERIRLELQIEEHEDTIAKGQARLQEIDRAKKRNLARTDLANRELDAEGKKIRENEAALHKRIEDVQVNLKAMVKGGTSDG